MNTCVSSIELRQIARKQPDQSYNACDMGASGRCTPVCLVTTWVQFIIMSASVVTRYQECYCIVADYSGHPLHKPEWLLQKDDLLIKI